MNGLRARIEGSERIDQHNLAVDTGKMLDEERSYDLLLIRLIASLHHGEKRTRLSYLALGEVQRREGERRRAVEIARHQEAAGGQRRQGEPLVSAGTQIACEELGGDS